jgi:sugar lactone lactonase YvrE
MNKRLIIFLIVLIFFFLQLSFADDSENVTGKRERIMDLYGQALKLKEKHDYNGYLEHIQKALLIISGRNLKYHLARAYSLTGQTKKALQTLKPLIQLGIFLDVDREKDFNPIKKEKEFIQILAKVKKQKQPIVKSKTAYVIPEKDLIPEGIAYDPVEKTFYLGSLEKFKVIKIDKDGKISDFTQSRQDGLVSTLGMAVDAKRRVLWVCTGFGYPKAGLPKELFGTSGIYKYHLKTGKLIKKYMLPIKEKHFLNDVAVTPGGRVYISNSHVPAVYTIDPGNDTIEKWVSLKDRFYPNGIAYSPVSKKVFVSSSTEITIIDTESKTIQPLTHSDDMFISSCDGLYYYKNSLIGVQNTVGNGRIVRIHLDYTQQKAVKLDILENLNPLFDIPTTGAIVDNIFYFMANTQLQKYDDNGNLPPFESLDKIKILKMSLEN